MLEKIQSLIDLEQMLLVSTNEKLVMLGKDFLNLSNKMEKGEFYRAVELDAEGNFQMRQGYKGDLVNVVRRLEYSRQSLLRQRMECIAQIQAYQGKLQQLMSQRNQYEPVPQTSSAMQTPLTMNMEQVGSKVSSPASFINPIQNENTMDRNAGKVR